MRRIAALLAVPVLVMPLTVSALAQESEPSEGPPPEDEVLSRMEEPVPPLFVVLTDPAEDEVVVRGSTIRVAGLTRPGAVVIVDGSLVEVGEDGSFATEVRLEDVVNLIEVLAIDPLSDEEASADLVVLTEE